MADIDDDRSLSEQSDRGRFTPDNLLRRDRFVDAVIEGRKDQIRRNDRYADPGERFTVDGVTYEVTDVYEQRLGDMTDADARREGFEDLEEYRAMIQRVHDKTDGGTGWNVENRVVVHEIERWD